MNNDEYINKRMNTKKIRQRTSINNDKQIKEKKGSKKGRCKDKQLE